MRPPAKSAKIALWLIIAAGGRSLFAIGRNTMLIDFHTHAFPDALCPRAVQKLAATAGEAPRTDGSLDDTRRVMRLHGVDRAVLANIAVSPSSQRSVNNWAGEVNGGEFIAFGSVHPDSPDWEQELDRIAGMGLRGIKLHPDYQGFFVDEPRMYPLYRHAAGLGLAILFHAGVDIGYPEPIHATPEGIRRVVLDLPGCRFIAAHMGGFRCWDGVEELLAGLPLCFDTAFCEGHLDREQMLRIIRKHGAENILFGSDLPWSDVDREYGFIKSLGLSREQEDGIFYKNALRLLGIGG